MLHKTGYHVKTDPPSPAALGTSPVCSEPQRDPNPLGCRAVSGQCQGERGPRCAGCRCPGPAPPGMVGGLLGQGRGNRAA